MILKENDFLYKCKLYDVTVIHAKEMLKNSNVVLEYDLDDFLAVCNACETFVLFYEYKYYIKDALRIDETIKAKELREIDKYKENAGALKATIAEHIDKWNELIETSDYTQPYELKIIASLNGVVTEIVYKDLWLGIQCGDSYVYALPGMSSRDIAEDITNRFALKHIFS